jgi:hypothetical protein
MLVAVDATRMTESTNTMADHCILNNDMPNTTGARSGVVDVRVDVAPSEPDDQALQVDESGHWFVEKECKSVEDARSFLNSFMKNVKE